MVLKFGRSARNRLLAVNFGVAVAYYLLAELSRILASTPNDVTPVWPPDGLAVAVAIIFGKGVLPGIALGSFLANFWAFWNPENCETLICSSLGILGIALGTTLGTWLGTSRLKHALGQRHPFGRVGSTVQFLVYAGLMGPLINASFGVATLVFQQAIAWPDAGGAWMTWWISNVAGIVILSPVLISLNDLIQLRSKDLINKELLEPSGAAPDRRHDMPFPPVNSAPQSSLIQPNSVQSSPSQSSPSQSSPSQSSPSQSSPSQSGRTPPEQTRPRELRPRNRSQHNLVRQASLLETICLSSLLFVIAKASFWGEQSLAYMLVPLLIWAAFRLGRLGATSAVLFTASMAILGTVRGRGIFADANLSHYLSALQSFIIVIAFTILILLAVLAERRTADNKLQMAIQELQTVNNALADQTIELGRVAQLKDEFLAMVSHELRTPLIGILGMSEILNDGMLGSLSLEQVDAIQKIDRSGQHLLALINDLLDLTSAETGQLKILKTSFEIKPLCQASLDLVAPIAAQKNIRLNVDFPDHLGTIYADSKRLQQVFTNLLINAIKFTPQGGQVCFLVTHYLPELFLKDATADVAGNTRDKADSVSLYFSVKDTGIGLSESDMEAVFSRFFQVNNQLNHRQDGLGLGLAIAKQLVELHQGTLRVASQLGEGSCFTVELPYTLPSDSSKLSQSRQSQLQLSTSQRSKSQRSKSQRSQSQILPTEDLNTAPYILIAEDDAVSRAVLTNYLKRHHYRLTIAHNGEEAIAQATQEKPALILMDIQMPVMDGLEAMRRLRQEQMFQDLPIIALTASSLEADKEKCLQAGATAYMSKPVQLKSLLSLIQSQALNTITEPSREP